VDAVMAEPTLADLPRALALDAARLALEDARETVTLATLPTAASLADEARRRVESWLSVRPQPVINATGVVIHTNLGRAPWAPEAVAAVAAIAGRYADVEVRLFDGERGGRGASVRDKLVRLTGAEDAIVVNNGAAAVLLALTALARDRDVIVSRGELVEIGGSFRVPDVIAAGGARLVSVGTTNRTRASDFAAAISPATAVLLKVHPSNFRMEGFVASVSVAELAAVAKAHGLAVVADVGSGALSDRGEEPGVREAVADGADVVAFSGDKLLGGPQAGILVGKAAHIERLRRHPMMRALRVGKETLAALDATLALHLAGKPTPVDAMLSADHVTLRARAAQIVATILAHGGNASLVEVDARAGGGAMAEVPLASVAVAVDVADPNAASDALRRGHPAVLVRIHRDRLLADVRTVFVEEDAALAARLASVAARG
jgi:L-seryl-tRNA(Ser) seleniumtransferase